MAFLFIQLLKPQNLEASLIPTFSHTPLSVYQQCQGSTFKMCSESDCFLWVCSWTRLAARCSKGRYSRDEFWMEGNMSFNQEAGHLGRRWTLVQKPTLRFLPGPRAFKGVQDSWSEKGVQWSVMFPAYVQTPWCQLQMLPPCLGAVWRVRLLFHDMQEDSVLSVKEDKVYRCTKRR